jgi:hypothetical protein
MHTSVENRVGFLGRDDLVNAWSQVYLSLMVYTAVFRGALPAAESALKLVGQLSIIELTNYGNFAELTV